MLMARRAAPFVYVIIGLLADWAFSERVSSAVWIIGALLLAAIYSLGIGRPVSARSSRRAADRAERRGR